LQKTPGMPGSTLHRFFISIVVPSILAIALYVISIFLVILPSFETNILGVKKEMISELTNAAWSLVEEYHLEAESGRMNEDSAMHLAALRVEQIRYGDQYKDYFWIIDKTPVMVMHPYRSDLEGSSLSNYEDPEGKLLFVEAVETVKNGGEGYIHYMWQWKDDSTRTVPKLSYVKEFEPWGWIIGTGIYLEDVSEEIRLLKKRLLRIALLITMVTGLILAFIIRQSLLIEKKRKQAEQSLKRSRQKYKSLVDASTEGTLMVLNEKIIYSNQKFYNLSGYDTDELRNLHIGNLFETPWEDLTGSISDPHKTVSSEGKLRCNDGSGKEVVIAVSRVSYGEQDGYILVLKEVDMQHQYKKSTEVFSSEIQASMALSFQPVKSFTREMMKCSSTTRIRDVAALMARKEQQVVFVVQDDLVIGVVTDSDLRTRVLAGSGEVDRPVLEIMSSPVVTISGEAPLHEGLILMRKHGISHLAVRSGTGRITGRVDYSDLIDFQPNAIIHLIHEINASEKIQQLKESYSRMTVMVRAFTDSGVHAVHITRTISLVNDAIHRRIITLALEEAGPPPCDFAFLVMGSEGRREQTLATDQDNAIVYADLPEEEQAGAEAYFLELGARINKDLNASGYQFCKGDMMAMNPRWTQPLSKWKEYFSGWVREGGPHDIMEASICFDFRVVFGDKTLAASLREHVHKIPGTQSAFYLHMARAIVKFKSPLNVFGGIAGSDAVSDEVNLDAKKVLFPLVAFLRLYAVREKIAETNSMERAALLHSGKILSDSIYEEVTESFAFVTGLRLRAQVEALGGSTPPGNLIDLNTLSRMERTNLKKILSGISELQSMVSLDFKGAE